MERPAVIRSSPRLASVIALLCVAAMFGLAGCSSDSASGESAGSSDPADAGASDAGATNDVATSSEVSLTLQFNSDSLDEILSSGQHVAIAREVDSSGDVGQIQWMVLKPLESNTITYDPSRAEVFASEATLDPGVVVNMDATADASDGDRVSYDANGAFSMSSGTAGSIEVENRATGTTTVGLSGTASINGSDEAASPFVAKSAQPDSVVEFTDTGKLMVWVTDVQDQAGTVIDSIPATATTIDTTTDPTTTLTWNDADGKFETAT